MIFLSEFKSILINHCALVIVWLYLAIPASADTLAWGINLPGTINHFKPTGNFIALTLDACGGEYDEALIQLLIREQIKATLFLSGKWIQRHPETTQILADNPLFELENHGQNHKPLTVHGYSAYGIQGTSSTQDVKAEILLNAATLKKFTGSNPLYFRSGTAHYDPESIKIAHATGEQVVNFSINGDAGATLREREIIRQLSKPEPGSIIIVHMNKPHSDTRKSLEKILPGLKHRGYRFVQLKEVLRR